MRPIGFFLLFALAMAVTALLLGCGGNASPTPTPTPTPSGGGTGGTVQYQVTLHDTSAGTTSMGSVSIVTAGDVTVQVSGGTPGTSYNVNFCLYPATLYLDNCMTSLTTIVADSSGAGQSTFHFPKSGNWAGIFRVMNGASVFVETSGHKNSFAANVMQMEPQTTTNPQGVGFTGLQDPGTGTLSAQGNGMTHVTLSKAVPNVTYEVIDCYMGGSSCYLAGTVLTDPSGNGASDVEISGPSQAIFRVQRGTDGAAVGFVTGFTVP